METPLIDNRVGLLATAACTAHAYKGARATLVVFLDVCVYLVAVAGALYHGV